MIRTDLDDVRAALREVAREVLEPRSPLRAGGGSGEPADWPQLAELGWLALEVPDSLGGAGVHFHELAVLLTEMGRAASTSSFLGSAVLANWVLAALDAGPERDDLLRRAASGATRVAVAVTAGSPSGTGFRLQAAGRRWAVDGAADFVPDAGGADRLLLPVPHPEGGDGIVIVDPTIAGVTVEEQPVVDGTRRLAAVTATAVEVDRAALWRAAGGGDGLMSMVADRAALAVACDSLGIGQAMLQATVAYAGSRRQFDRPIGSFQAVKHACADMLVQIEAAEELVGAAVAAISDGRHGSAVAVSMAKAQATAMAVEVAGKAVQLHGGIGYTWESGLPAFLKRATLNRSLFGSPADHRRRLAARYLD